MMTKTKSTAVESKHTPTPWVVAAGSDTVYAGPIFVCDLELDDGDLEVMAANAEHIVLCVNAHDGLVAALESILEEAVYIVKHDSPGGELLGYLQTVRGTSRAALTRAANGEDS